MAMGQTNDGIVTPVGLQTVQVWRSRSSGVRMQGGAQMVQMPRHTARALALPPASRAVTSCIPRLLTSWPRYYVRARQSPSDYDELLERSEVRPPLCRRPWTMGIRHIKATIISMSKSITSFHSCIYCNLSQTRTKTFPKAFHLLQ